MAPALSSTGRRWNKFSTGRAKGKPFSMVRMSFLNLAVATIFIALVIFCMFLMARIRMDSVFNVAALRVCTSSARLAPLALARPAV